MSNLAPSRPVAIFALMAALAAAPHAGAGPAARPASSPQSAGAAASAPTNSTSKIGTKKPIVPADKIAPGAVQKATAK